MSDNRFVKALNEQIAYEFGASQQYAAVAVHYDAETLPRLAAHFYRQAVEERNHAMMMVQFLLDAGEDVVIPGVEAPRTTFGDTVEPVALALEQERRVTSQINALAALAREHGDYAGAFAQWLPLATSVIDVPAFLRALAAIGYDGPVRAEPFNEALRKMPREEALAATALAMKKALSMIEAT
jgi:ferritin